jgi:hypothetical protein
MTNQNTSPKAIKYTSLWLAGRDKKEKVNARKPEVYGDK